MCCIREHVGYHLLGSPSTRHIGKWARGWAVSKWQSQDKQQGGCLKVYTRECLKAKPWPSTLSNQRGQWSWQEKAGHPAQNPMKELWPPKSLKQSGSAPWTVAFKLQQVCTTHPLDQNQQAQQIVASPSPVPWRPHRAISTFYYCPHTASKFLPT